MSDGWFDSFRRKAAAAISPDYTDEITESDESSEKTSANANAPPLSSFSSAFKETTFSKTTPQKPNESSPEVSETSSATMRLSETVKQKRDDLQQRLAAKRKLMMEQYETTERQYNCYERELCKKMFERERLLEAQKRASALLAALKHTRNTIIDSVATPSGESVDSNARAKRLMALERKTQETMQVLFEIRSMIKHLYTVLKRLVIAYRRSTQMLRFFEKSVDSLDTFFHALELANENMSLISIMKTFPALIQEMSMTQGDSSSATFSRAELDKTMNEYTRSIERITDYHADITDAAIGAVAQEPLQTAGLMEDEIGISFSQLEKEFFLNDPMTSSRNGQSPFSGLSESDVMRINEALLSDSFFGTPKKTSIDDAATPLSSKSSLHNSSSSSSSMSTDMGELYQSTEDIWSFVGLGDLGGTERQTFPPTGHTNTTPGRSTGTDFFLPSSKSPQTPVSQKKTQKTLPSEKAKKEQITYTESRETRKTRAQKTDQVLANLF